MRILLVLTAVVVGFTAWQHGRLAENEGRLALVASELAQRPVGVGCPGFWTRLVEITPYAGWVRFDEHGRPSDETHLAAGTCSSLERLWRAEPPPTFACLLDRSCTRDALEAVDALVTLAHESWHLRGYANEAQAQCYAVQTSELTARLFGVAPRDARLVALYVAARDAAAVRDDYHSVECRRGGRYDLAPGTLAWPTG
jgi:hypothetical protein